jgi:hypothetical protein
MSRQLLREARRAQEALEDVEEAPLPGPNELRRAAAYVEAMEDIFEADDFEARLLNGENAADVQRLHAFAMEAFYWQSEANSECNLLDLSIDRRLEPVQRTIEANDNNDALTPVLANVATDMRQYAGLEDGTGPGAVEVTTAEQEFAFIRDLQTQDVGVDCDGREDLDCINDIDALRLELKAMELADSLEVAGSRGVWVRNWQSCLAHTVKFRIELSVSRLSFGCGLNNQYHLQAREKQAIGEYLVEEQGCALNDRQGAELRVSPAAAVACQNLQGGDDCTFGDVDGIRVDGKCVVDAGVPTCEPRVCSDPAALDYYKDEDTRCFLIEAYNECLVPAFDAINDVYPVDPALDAVPAACNFDEDEE